MFPSVSQYNDDAFQAAGLFSVGRPQIETPQIETPQIETRKQAVKRAAPPAALRPICRGKGRRLWGGRIFYATLDWHTNFVGIGALPYLTAVVLYRYSDLLTGHLAFLR